MLTVSFPGGVRVDATMNGHTVRTDQPPPVGSGTAMSPFDLFLASIATCAGFYALRFCQQRNLDTEGLELSAAIERDAAGKHVDRVRIEIGLPHGFPEKYREAILRSVEQCTVKRHLSDPPAIEVVAAASGSAEAASVLALP